MAFNALIFDRKFFLQPASAKAWLANARTGKSAADLGDLCQPGKYSMAATMHGKAWFVRLAAGPVPLIPDLPDPVALEQGVNAYPAPVPPAETAGVAVPSAVKP